MADSINKHFFLRKLHSLTGLVPIGVFLCVHLWTNSLARKGAVAFNGAAADIHKINYLMLVEIFGIALPILFHAGYGIVIWWQSQNVLVGNSPQYKWTSNWLYIAQRASGGIAALYILTHVWSTRVQTLMHPELMKDLYTYMQTQLANPLVATWYIVGTLAATFHLANGLRLMGMTWGLTIGERSQRFASAFALVVFVGLSYLGIQSLVGFGIYGITAAGA